MMQPIRCRMSKKRFSKTGIALVGCMLVCLIICLAVGLPKGFGGEKKQNLDDENTPGITDIMDGNSPVMIYDKRESTKVLMEAFNDENVAGVVLVCDNGASEFSGETFGDVKNVYRALKNILVEDEIASGASTDGSIWGSAVFELEDGSKCSFEFSKCDVLIIDGKAYRISGYEELWKLAEEEQ